MRYLAAVALLVLLGAVIVLTGCQLMAGNPNAITLTAQEKTQAIAIAEARQQLLFDRQASENQFQKRQNELDLESAKLCFSLKKAHSIDPTVRYWLDEWRGELRKGE